MQKMIHNLRKQPEEMRRHILHVLMVCFAVILFFLWIFSLGRNFTNTDTQAKMSQDLKPFSILKDNLSNGLNNINSIILWPKNPQMN